MMMDIQHLIDGWTAEEQRGRSETQMTLGGAIERLSYLPPNLKIKGLGGFNSYRGYYCDLAFEPQGAPLKVQTLLTQCKSAMGRVYFGYKGGEYQMGEKTPLWVADYGSRGERLMSINDDGTITTKPEED